MQINNVRDLDMAIATLESRKTVQEKLLKTQVNEIVESFKPKNLLKSAFKSATENGSTGGILLKAAGSIGTSVLGGKLLAGTGIFNKLAGTALNAGAANGLLNNKDKIMAWGKAIYQNLFKKKA